MATLVEDDPEAPFFTATTPGCRGGRYSIPWIAPFYPWSFFIILGVKQGGIKCHFWFFGMTRPDNEPRFPGPLADTLIIWPILLNVIPRTHSFAGVKDVLTLCKEYSQRILSFTYREVTKFLYLDARPQII